MSTTSSPDTSNYTSLNANQPPNLRYLTNFYSERATDQSRIVYLFRNTGISIKIIVHTKIPVPKFKALLWTWMRNKQLNRMASEGGEVEILVVERFEMGYEGANVEHEDKETAIKGSEEGVEGTDP
ncbi:unnamed protein product [Aureobasidium mustum]|uniref:Uncharacterized protein n=1 Tax=Aureobasidium mustum TaxID=2773714 RepID=A0A9N8PLW5_9PEZI|nr:unnamed protein product [Aureobasidium mustum]